STPAKMLTGFSLSKALAISVNSLPAAGRGPSQPSAQTITATAEGRVSQDRRTAAGYQAVPEGASPQRGALAPRVEGRRLKVETPDPQLSTFDVRLSTTYHALSGRSPSSSSGGSSDLSGGASPPASRFRRSRRGRGR